MNWTRNGILCMTRLLNATINFTRYGNPFKIVNNMTKTRTDLKLKDRVHMKVTEVNVIISKINNITALPFGQRWKNFSVQIIECNQKMLVKIEGNTQATRLSQDAPNWSIIAAIEAKIEVIKMTEKRDSACDTFKRPPKNNLIASTVIDNKNEQPSASKHARCRRMSNQRVLIWPCPLGIAAGSSG